MYDARDPFLASVGRLDTATELRNAAIRNRMESRHERQILADSADERERLNYQHDIDPRTSALCIGMLMGWAAAWLVFWIGSFHA